MLLGSVGAYMSSPRTVVTLNANVDNIAMGILTMYPISDVMVHSAWSGIPYLSISLSLNVILTLMIVGRLVLHGRNIRTATGSPAGRLYKTIATMLIESCALFALNSLMVLGTWAARDSATDVFTSMLGVTQVRLSSMTGRSM